MNGEDLKAFVDGELPAWKRWLVARRIAKDPALQAEVEALQKLSNELAALDLPDSPLSDGLRTRLLSTAPEPATLQALVAPRRSPAKTVAYGLLGASALACLAVVFVPRPERESTRARGAAPAAPVPAAASAEVAQEPPAMAAPVSDLNKNADTSATAGGAASAAPAEFGASRRVTSEAQPGNAVANRAEDSIAMQKRKQDSLLQTAKAAAPADSAYYGGRPNAAAKAALRPPQKQVIELVSSSDKDSRVALLKQVEEAVKRYGGKVLKHEPLEVTLPSALRSTARQKLLALTEVGPTKERKRANGMDADKEASSSESRLKVTVYFKD